MPTAGKISDASTHWASSRRSAPPACRTARRRRDAQKARRLATAEDVQRHDDSRAGRRRAPQAMERVKANKLRHEVVRRRVAVGPQEADDLLHGREARRLPQSRARPRGAVSHAHRAQTDRRSRRSQTTRRHRSLRSRVLLGVVAAGASPREPRRREGPAAVAEPGADLRRVRAPHVLPAVRARVLRAEPQALPEGSEGAHHARAARRRSSRTTSSTSA